MKSVYFLALRELKIRFKSKIFIWTTILGPIFLLIMMIVPVGLQLKNSEHAIVQVLDLTQTERIDTCFKDNDKMSFIVMHGNETEILKAFDYSSHDALLILKPLDKNGIIPELTLKSHYDLSEFEKIFLKNYIKGIYQNEILKRLNNSELATILNQEIVFDELKELDFAYQQTSKEVRDSWGLGASIILYFFLMFYGMQLMRSTTEEKSSRVFEVLITTVKPVQILLGKLTGIGLSALFQFTVWLTVVGGIGNWLYAHFQLQMYNSSNISNTLKIVKDQQQAMDVAFLVQAFEGISFFKLGFGFIVFFVLGYLLYGTLLATIGACVDSESDTQPLLIPITLPLLFSFVMASQVQANPNTLMSKILCNFPLSSPICALINIPNGATWVQILVSISLLIIFLFPLIWLCSKVFAAGLLLNGKKTSWGDIFKLLKM
ncbi:MAG: hypothetical protein RLZZ175_2186 [Bacteroidota bacterium]|jgi:ABC-2 type transport system permease protein